MKFSLKIDLPMKTILSLLIVALAAIQVCMFFFVGISLFQSVAILLSITSLSFARRMLDVSAALESLEHGEFRNKLADSLDDARHEHAEYAKWGGLIFIATIIGLGLIANDSTRITVMSERIATVIMSLLTLKFTLLKIRLGAILKSIDTATATASA